MLSKRSIAIALFKTAGSFVPIALLLWGCGGGGGNSTGGSSGGGTLTTSSVSLTLPSSIQVGGTATATCVVRMSDGSTNSGCTYKSDATSVATVSAAGVVTGVAIGTANITATSSDGTKFDTKPVTVSAVPVTTTSVTLTLASSSVQVGGTAAATCTVKMSDNSTNSNCTYKSDAASVATVSAAGVVTGVAIGTANITATSSDGTKFDTKPVTVSAAVVSITNVTITITPSVIFQIGDQGGAQGAVHYTDGSVTHQVTYASDNTSVATVDATTGVITAKAAGTANITATSTADTTKKSYPAQITVQAPVAITGITASCGPTSFSTDDTTQCSATVTGTGAYNPAVTWSVASGGGTISASGLYTPGDAGTVIVKARSVQDGTQSASVTLTVAWGKPQITGLSRTYLYAPALDEPLTVMGKNFSSTDTITLTLPGSLVFATLVNSTRIDLQLNLGDRSIGLFGVAVCRADKVTCTATYHYADVGDQNSLSLGADGTLYQNDMGNGIARILRGSDRGYVWPFTPHVSGGVVIFTPGSAILTDPRYQIPVDNKTGYLVYNGTTQGSGYLNYLAIATYDGNGREWVSQDVRNSNACGSRPQSSPVTNLVSCYPANVPNAPLTSVSLGTEPWTLKMLTLHSKDYACVYTRKGTPMLWKLDAVTATPVGSYAPVGFTESATVLANPGSKMIGWQIATFYGGPAAGTVALMSSYDGALHLIDGDTMKAKLAPVALSGNLVRVAADETHGAVIVALSDMSDPTAPKTTFASVNVADGTVKTLTSTSTVFPVGLGVSPDGSWIYVCERNVCEAQPNQ